MEKKEEQKYRNFGTFFKTIEFWDISSFCKSRNYRILGRFFYSCKKQRNFGTFYFYGNKKYANFGTFLKMKRKKCRIMGQKMRQNKKLWNFGTKWNVVE